MATRRERLEEREGAIVSAARTVFLEKGYEKATMLEIANLAGVAQGSTYLYFRNKQAVLGAVLGDFYAQLTTSARDGLGEIPERRTLDRLNFLAHHHLEWVLGDWKLMLLGVSLLRDKPDYAESETYRLNREYTAAFDEVLRYGISRGDVRDDVPLWLLRDQFFGTLEYIARTLVLRNKQDEIDVAVDTVLSVMYTGMQVDESDTDAGGVRSLIERLEVSVERLEAGG